MVLIILQKNDINQRGIIWYSLFPVISLRLDMTRVSLPVLRYTSASSAAPLISSSLSSSDFIASLSTQTYQNTKYIKSQLLIMYMNYKLITSMILRLWPHCSFSSSTCGLGRYQQQMMCFMSEKKEKDFTYEPAWWSLGHMNPQ